MYLRIERTSKQRLFSNFYAHVVGFYFFEYFLNTNLKEKDGDENLKCPLCRTDVQETELVLDKDIDVQVKVWMKKMKQSKSLTKCDILFTHKLIF